MERSKYFIPDVEDLHMGYELQYNTNSEMGWMSMVIASYHFKTIIPPDKQGIDIFIATEYLKQPERIRVPYITPEQIVAEGWKEKDTNVIGRFAFQKDNYFMVLDLRKEMPFIEMIYRDPSVNESVNNPEVFHLILNCKDINTFRSIIKLLL